VSYKKQELLTLREHLGGGGSSFVGGLMSCLCYLCLLARGGVQHILCCVFFSVFKPTLLVSMDCPFLLAPSVFSNIFFFT